MFFVVEEVVVDEEEEKRLKIKVVVGQIQAETHTPEKKVKVSKLKK